MMVEAEATPETIELIAGGATSPTEDVVASGLEAAKPPIAVLCAAQRELAAKAAKPTGEFPLLLDYGQDLLEALTAAVKHRARRGAADRRQAGARGRARPGTRAGRGAHGRPVRGSREGDRRRLPVADEDPGARAGHPRQGAYRRSGAHRHPGTVRRGRRAPAGARLGAVRARRDPDPGRHHAGDAAHGADHRHAQPGQPQALHAQLQLPAVLDR